jgi:hypothetical protein
MLSSFRKVCGSSFLAQTSVCNLCPSSFSGFYERHSLKTGKNGSPLLADSGLGLRLFSSKEEGNKIEKEEESNKREEETEDRFNEAERRRKEGIPDIIRSKRIIYKKDAAPTFFYEKNALTLFFNMIIYKAFKPKFVVRNAEKLLQYFEKIAGNFININ